MSAPREPIVIPDDAVATNDVQNAIYPVEYEGHFEGILISIEDIRKRIRDLARQIHEDYRGKRPVLVCVLKGANPFYQHLQGELQELRQGFTMEFVRATSYDGLSTSGTVTLSGGLDPQNLMGRHVILVEDIIDTGTTLAHSLPVIAERAKPQSMEVCSLLVKRLKDPPKVQAKYLGFSVPDAFVIGYGLDYNELYRDLRDIWTISKAGIDFDGNFNGINRTGHTRAIQTNDELPASDDEDILS